MLFMIPMDTADVALNSSIILITLMIVFPGVLITLLMIWVVRALGGRALGFTKPKPRRFRFAK